MLYEVITLSALVLGASLLVSTQGLAQDAQPRTVGWVEQALILPENVPVTIKMDTGALTSSMDAQALRRFDRNGEPWVSYDVQANDRRSGRMSRLHFERPVLRNVRLRGAGGEDRRPVVRMTLCIGDRVYEEEFSLRDRSDMNYPVLIGRRTLEHLGLVDVTRTFTMPPNCAP